MEGIFLHWVLVVLSNPILFCLQIDPLSKETTNILKLEYRGKLSTVVH